MLEYLKGLNESQKKAVMHTKGPLLVLAGAGSGKTRVLTSRIARLVKEKICAPANILAVTFTNKAAREMKERIARAVSSKAADAMAVSTFHSLGARILREHGEAIGLHKSFSIMSDYDRVAAIKGIMRVSGKSMQEESHEKFATMISLAKNAGLDPETYAANDMALVKATKVYKAYSAMIFKQQSVDFDDLLLLPLRLFERHPDILEKYQKKYTFVSIDEFQDTNAVQMRLAKLLAAPQNNLLVVGDDDQSIYSWRGAVIDNILGFGSHFKDCTTVILDKNYRSTRQILSGAQTIVEKNSKRTAKSITAVGGDGDPIMHYRGDDEEDEADWVAQTIASNVAGRQFALRDHALLFRVNALVARFEEALRRARIPYKTVGTTSFFDRKEIRDVMAYLRFFANPEDEMSFMRMLKVPEKGFGKDTFEALDELAAGRRISMWKAANHAGELTTIGDGQKAKIAEFVSFCRRYQDRFRSEPLSATFRALMTENGYLQDLARAYQQEDGTNIRLANVEEIINGLALFEKKRTHPLLSDYLQELSLLVADENEEEDTRNKNAVTLMTMHKSKGLEFPAVFLPGLDDAIVPSPRTIEEGKIDEERRLFYVAMTRAKKRLYLTWSATKLFRNKTSKVTPCRFIFEIPQEFLDGPLGEKADANREIFLQDFFKQMNQKLEKPSPLDIIK